MASSEEKSSSRSGLGWFPKLILWAAVIGFGYVYLSSVDREGGGTTAASMLDSIAKLSPVSLSSLPGFSDKKESSTGSAEVAQADEAPKTEAAAKPVAHAESAAFTRALVSDTPVSSAETPKSTPQPPVTYAAAAMKAPAESTPAPAAPAHAEKSAPIVSAPIEPPASAPIAAAPSAPAPIASRPMPAPVAAQPPMSPSPAMSAPSEQSRMTASEWAAMRQQQRAEMMAQYEAMRREADERMRQYWGQMREAMPTAPYGYQGYAPGYMPGYAPGYAPGVYGPQVR